MIEWFAWVQIVVALISAVVCIVQFARKTGPNDITLGLTILIGIGLIVQIIIAAIAPAFGNTATGDPLEFWMYLISAALLPFAAAFWALVDRGRWSNLVLSVVAFSVAVMVYRMLFIWTIQVA